MIIERIGSCAMLEQMAEEATELAQAALKLSRILRGENPTPVTLDEAEKHVIEEYTDVIQCAGEMELHPDITQITRKQERFVQRWKQYKQEGGLDRVNN